MIWNWGYCNYIVPASLQCHLQTFLKTKPNLRAWKKVSFSNLVEPNSLPYTLTVFLNMTDKTQEWKTVIIPGVSPIYNRRLATTSAMRVGWFVSQLSELYEIRLLIYFDLRIVFIASYNLSKHISQSSLKSASILKYLKLSTCRTIKQIFSFQILCSPSSIGNYGTVERLIWTASKK